jgi:hypothetical protein
MLVEQCRAKEEPAAHPSPPPYPVQIKGRRKNISKKELTPQCQDYIRSSDSVVVFVVAME